MLKNRKNGSLNGTFRYVTLRKNNVMKHEVLQCNIALQNTIT